MSEYAPRRLQVANVKADQIRATQAATVATACHNCVDGLTDLIKHCKLNVPVRNVCEFVADAIVLPAGEPVHAEAIPAGLKGKRVLVVDDEPDVVTYIAAILEDAGLRPLKARNAQEGMAIARAERPEMITLDVSMPGRSGIEVFTRLRSDPDLATIPVCIVTGAIDFRQLLYHRNVPPPDAFLDKPIKPALLLMTVRKILEHRHRVKAPAGMAPA